MTAIDGNYNEYCIYGVKVGTEYDTLGSAAGWKCSFRPLSHLTRLRNQHAIVLFSHTMLRIIGNLFGETPRYAVLGQLMLSTGLYSCHLDSLPSHLQSSFSRLIATNETTCMCKYTAIDAGHLT